MSFRDFTFPDVETQLQLTHTETDLFSAVAPLPLRPEFAAMLQDGVELATAINTEKARSEFIIAPLLWELRKLFRGQFGLFSGVSLDVDASRGLNEFCDFLLSRSPHQLVMTSPLIAVVEAKNDNPLSGLGQCIAAMVAAAEFNRLAGEAPGATFGVVTSGGAWRFLRLERSNVLIDVREYFISDAGKIVGIFAHILQSP